MIEKDYNMKLKKKSPGIIYVPWHEVENREKLIEIRKNYYECKTLEEKIELYENALDLIS